MVSYGPNPRVTDRRALGAAGGVALSSTAVFTPFIEGQQALALTFVDPSGGATRGKFLYCPRGAILKATDKLATAAAITDATETLQDGSTSTVLSLNSLDVAANLDFLYVGCHVPFRGANIDVVNTNGTASVLTVKYWNGTAWADITATDGTVSGGATLAVDGSVTWTVPADWVAGPLGSIAIGGSAGIADTTLNVGRHMMPFYWTRWEVSVQLDATVSIAHMLLLNKSATAYAELSDGQNIEEIIETGILYGGSAGVELLSDAGAAKMLVVAGKCGGRF